MKAIPGFQPSGHAEHVLKCSMHFSAAAKKVSKKPARLCRQAEINLFSSRKENS